MFGLYLGGVFDIGVSSAFFFSFGWICIAETLICCSL